MTNRYKGNFLSDRNNVPNFCAKLAAIFTAAGRQLRLKLRKILTTNLFQNILLFIRRQVTCHLLFVFLLLYLEALVCHCNGCSEDHTNYVFSQVILCSMCTGQENGREDG